MTNTSDITFVCCVESGSLESQTIRMIESLRRYGGKFSTAPVVAVTPRFGPPLSRKTCQILDRYEVEHLVLRSDIGNTRYSWNHFMNKPHAILAVDDRSKSEAIGWLDSDLLFIGEAEQLNLRADESFLACTTDSSGGTTGLTDPMEPYWLSACKALNLDIELLPWVTTEKGQVRIRYYFNSGMFIYRRETSFANQYLKNCTKILDAYISSKVCGFFYTDQVALGLTAFQLSLSWRSLALSHNFTMTPKEHKIFYMEELFKEARIVHYHGAMWPASWPVFLECFCNTHPEVGEWLASLGPMSNSAPWQWRLLSKLLKTVRSRTENTYNRNCQIV
ncbi:MAG TPA: hypothetical protein V6D21_10550 [Candidatus Obscuribacterales bacterium]